MNKKIILFVGLALILLSSLSFATYTAPDNINPNTAMDDAGNVSSAIETVLGVAQWIGYIVGIAMVIWCGVKYLTAGAGTKAQVKSTMIPILVGAFLVALAPTIAHWLFNAFGSNGGSVSAPLSGGGAVAASIQTIL